jgi:hypothetical protein
MAKMKLTKVLKETIEHEKQKQKTQAEMQSYVSNFRKRLNDLKSKMREDGYGV